MNLSKKNLAVIYAHQIGFKIKDNKIFNPSNNEVQFFVRNGCPSINVKVPIDHINHAKSDKELRTISVHKLAAYEKFGSVVFEKDICVKHINNDKLDFSFSNLEIYKKPPENIEET